MRIIPTSENSKLKHYGVLCSLGLLCCICWQVVTDVSGQYDFMQCFHCIAPRCFCLLYLSTGTRRARPTTLLRVTFSVSERVPFVLCVTLHFLFRNAFPLCFVSRYFSICRTDVFPLRRVPLLSLRFHFISPRTFTVLLDASRRFSLPEILKQTDTLWNSWLSKTLWVSTAFHLALFAAQTIVTCHYGFQN